MRPKTSTKQKKTDKNTWQMQVENTVGVSWD